MKLNMPLRHTATQAVVQLFRAGESFGFEELQIKLGTSGLKDLDVLRKVMRTCVQYRLYRQGYCYRNGHRRRWYVPNNAVIPREKLLQQQFLDRLAQRDTSYNGTRNRLRGVLRGGL